MKVLFLDIDGVLNTSEWLKDRVKGTEDRDAYYLSMIDPAAVGLLNQVLERTGCEVVLSSTWRIAHERPAMQRLLEIKGFNGAILDYTPRKGTEAIPIRRKPGGPWVNAKFSEYVDRGYEIHAWLEKHPEVTSFAILDDESDMAHLKHRLVQTSFQHWAEYPEGPLGMHQGTVDDLVAMLNGE